MEPRERPPAPPPNVKTRKPRHGSGIASSSTEIIPPRIFILPLLWRNAASWMMRGRSLWWDSRSIQPSQSAASVTVDRATIPYIWRDASARLKVCAWPAYRRNKHKRYTAQSRDCLGLPNLQVINCDVHVAKCAIETQHRASPRLFIRTRLNESSQSILSKCPLLQVFRIHAKPTSL
jgi:hypothetical protein